MYVISVIKKVKYVFKNLELGILCKPVHRIKPKFNGKNVWKKLQKILKVKKQAIFILVQH